MKTAIKKSAFQALAESKATTGRTHRMLVAASDARGLGKRVYVMAGNREHAERLRSYYEYLKLQESGAHQIEWVTPTTLDGFNWGTGYFDAGSSNSELFIDHYAVEIHLLHGMEQWFRFQEGAGHES